VKIKATTIQWKP